MDSKLRTILFRNSNLIRKNKITIGNIFNENQLGGGKKLVISYKNNDY